MVETSSGLTIHKQNETRGGRVKNAGTFYTIQTESGGVVSSVGRLRSAKQICSELETILGKHFAVGASDASIWSMIMTNPVLRGYITDYRHDRFTSFTIRGYDAGQIEDQIIPSG